MLNKIGKRTWLSFSISFGEHITNLSQGQEVVFALEGGKLHISMVNGQFNFANLKSPLSPPFKPNQVIVSNDDESVISCIFYKGKNPRIECLKGDFLIDCFGNIKKKKDPCSLNANFIVKIDDIKIVNHEDIYPRGTDIKKISKLKKRISELSVKKEFIKSKLGGDGPNFSLSRESLKL